MDIPEHIYKIIPSGEFPIALGGCRNNGVHYDCCEYNIVLFDGNKKNTNSVFQFKQHEKESHVMLHHCSIDEADARSLYLMNHLSVIQDDSWKLKIKLLNTKRNSKLILDSYTKSCLVESSFYATKAKQGIKENNPVSSLWLKCGALFYADALCLLLGGRPSPSHMLSYLRKPRNRLIADAVLVVNQCLGIERTTKTLLNRMLESTVGLSDIVEKNSGHSKIIREKFDNFLKISLLADCYFYLAYINRDNLLREEKSLEDGTERYHIAKVGMDLDNDLVRVGRQTALLLDSVNSLHSFLTNIKT